MSLYRFRNPQARIPQWSCEAAERWILRAPTGWGKSVWLQQLALLRDASHSEVYWREERVTPNTASALRAQWMYLPQSGFRAPETLAVHLQKVFTLTAYRKIDQLDFLTRFKQALASFGMEHLAIESRYLADLSGGELQAISLARAVLLGPAALLLDEPTSAMDGELARKVEAWITKHFTGAWVWITHDANQAERLGAAGARAITC